MDSSMPSPAQMIKSAQSIMTAMSYFSPIITILSMLIFSLFIGAPLKWLVYMFWVIVSTVAWWGGMYIVGKNAANTIDTTNKVKSLFPITYGSFILSFTTFYFILPMSVSGNINYGIMAYMLCYLFYDVFIKWRMVPWQTLIGYILGGSLFGASTSMIMYGMQMKKHLYVDSGGGGSGGESGTQCSMPSRSTFRCSVYKNGELVSTHMK